MVKILINRIHALFLFGLAISAVSGQALFIQEPLVRVRIIKTIDALNLSLSGEWSLHESFYGDTTLIDDPALHLNNIAGQLMINDSSGVLLQSSTAFSLFPLSDTSSIMIRNVPYGVGWWWAGTEDRIYEGDIHIYVDSNSEMIVTVALALEAYLKGVVPYEIGGESPLEALKAQAVAARSEAVIALTSKLYSGKHYDLTSDVECQVFSGNLRRTAASDFAVEQTRGIILSEKGQPINAYYASNCGGHGELIENVWPSRPGPETYLVALPDKAHKSGPKLNRNWKARRWIKSSPAVYCNPDLESSLPTWSRKNFRWTREFTTEELTTMLSDDKELGSFKKFKALKRGASGRIIKALFVFDHGSFSVEGELVLRQLFKPSFPSAAFYLKKRGGSIVISGAGWGHGVGMCQSGAIAQASRGIGFKQILKHYYTKAELLDLYRGEVTKK